MTARVFIHPRSGSVIHVAWRFARLGYALRTTLRGNLEARLLTEIIAAKEKLCQKQQKCER